VIVGRRRHASKLIAYTAISLVTLTAVVTAVNSAGAIDTTPKHTAAKAKTAARQSIAHARSATLTSQSIPSASMGALSLNAPIVGMASTPTGRGSWRVGSDGGIFASGDAKFYGSAGGHHLNRPIAGMAATPTGRGYWFVATDGGIFTFGDAHFYGSTGALHLNQPIVAMASTRSGHGYWLIARDGGVFSFGDAHFYGSTGALHLNQPIVGVAATRSGRGYWFVARDGGVFSFGDAHFRGSIGGASFGLSVVSMAPNGNGYLLLASNGRVFNFGNATNYGSAKNACTDAPAVAIATAPNALGYWIAFANAQAFALTPAKSGPKCAAPARPKIAPAAADLLNRMNEERGARGLAPLAWNASLAGYAGNWSRNMGNGNNLHHSDIGSLLGPFDYVGENIATGSKGVSAGALHVAWMHSQEHRDNILSPGFQAVGIGVYCSPNGSIWATTEFGRPTSSGQPPAYNGGTSVNPVSRSDGDSISC
jgi:uncharacterized protein YkwD